MVNNVYAQFIDTSGATSITLSTQAMPNGTVYVPAGSITTLSGVCMTNISTTIAHSTLNVTGITANGTAGASVSHSGSYWYINGNSFVTSSLTISIGASTGGTPGLGAILLTAATPTNNSYIADAVEDWWTESGSTQCNWIYVKRPNYPNGNTYNRYDFASWSVVIPQSGGTKTVKGACTGTTAQSVKYTSVAIYYFTYNSPGTNAETNWLTVTPATGTTHTSTTITISGTANNTAAHRAAMIVFTFGTNTQKQAIVVNQAGTGETPSTGVSFGYYTWHGGLAQPTFGSVYLPKGYKWNAYEVWGMPSWDYMSTHKEPRIAGQKIFSAALSNCFTTGASTTLTASYIDNFVDVAKTTFPPFRGSDNSNVYEGPKVPGTGYQTHFNGYGYAFQVVVRSIENIIQKSLVTHVICPAGTTNAVTWLPAIPKRMTEIWIDDNWEWAADTKGYATVADYFYRPGGLFARHAAGSDTSDPFDGANKFVPTGTDFTYNGTSYELWEGRDAGSGFYGLLSKAYTWEDLWKMSAEADATNRNCPFFMMLSSDKTEYHPQGGEPFDELFDLLCVR